jgi:nucleotide-binding universal stress UspA family protein
METSPNTPTASGTGPRHEVVVGVDGSGGGQAALRYAIDEARRRGATLRIVGVWNLPSAAYMAVPLPVDFSDDCEKAAQTSIDRTIEAVGKPTDVPVEIVVRQGQPAGVLVRESKTADVLVVGTRGLGGFREMLLGSVSQGCVHHALCPVIVVPDGSRQAAAPAAEVAA